MHSKTVLDNVYSLVQTKDSVNILETTFISVFPNKSLDLEILLFFNVGICVQSYPFRYFLSEVNTNPSVAFGFHTFLTIGINSERRNHSVFSVCCIAEQSLGKEA